MNSTDDVLNAIEKHDNVDFQDLCLALIQKQTEYIKLLSDEIDSLAPLASTHGWESENIKSGRLLRTQISVIDEQISKHIN